MLDTAYGKQFGGETKRDRDAMKRSKAKGLNLPMPLLKETNVCLGMIVQDSVWREWWVQAEASRNE
eukprot:4516533-Karenia_brevis.AAC.1